MVEIRTNRKQKKQNKKKKTKKYPRQTMQVVVKLIQFFIFSKTYQIMQKKQNIKKWNKIRKIVQKTFIHFPKFTQIQKIHLA